VSGAAQLRSLVTPDMRALIGRAAWPPQTVEVHEADILRYLEATGDGDLRRDQAGVLLAPPMFLPPYAVGGTIGEDGRRARPGETVIAPRGLVRRLMGGCDITFSSPIRAGETITCTATFVDIHQKDGRGGPLVFVVTDVTYRNADDERKRTERWTIIHR
jgi:hydroxyacyl-ACP dehydratase HTD2-like protein with hotdog domain